MAKGNAAGAAIFWTRQKEEGKGQNHIAARKQVLTKGTITSSSMLDESSKEKSVARSAQRNPVCGPRQCWRRYQFPQQLSNLRNGEETEDLEEGSYGKL